MKSQYVLIDYENVQPCDLKQLNGGAFKVKVFLGANQAKVPVDLANAIQPLGSNAEYVALGSGGNNALDFHIAYYIGWLSHADPEASFAIISKDTGFDPLIDHLKARRVAITRAASISALPWFRPALPVANDVRLQLVIDDLIRRKAAKPRSLGALRSTIDALFRKELGEPELDSLVKLLGKRGIVTFEGTKVHYHLPAPPQVA